MSGGRNVKTFRWDHRLQDIFMAFLSDSDGSDIGSTVPCREEAHG